MEHKEYVCIPIGDGGKLKIMSLVNSYIQTHGFVIYLDEAGYAAYGIARSVCAKHEGTQSKCDCPTEYVHHGFVHELTWTLFRLDAPRAKDEVIHHRVHKLENRIKNLEKLTRAQHATIHNKKRQKSGYRERFESGGLYRPHYPQPVIQMPVSNLPYSPPTQPRIQTFSRRLRVAEEQFASRYHSLRAELNHLDSGQVIPPSAASSEWRTPASRKSRLKMPRLHCTPAEAAVVLASIKHWSAPDTRQAAAQELGAPVEFINAIWDRPSVFVARQRWALYRRLPSAGRKRVRD